MNWWQCLVLAVCVMGAALAGLSFYGAASWAGTTRALMARLEAAGTAGAWPSALATHFDLRELDGLPAPVQRYFRTVLTPGQPMVTAASIALSGRFNLSPTREQWKPFTSQQRILTHRPGFLWDARVLVLPGVVVRVVDSYIAGEGRLRAALLGLFTVADAHGGDELARGEFMRYLAEAAWYPTALLPSQGVQWTAVDEASAQATIVDGPLALSLLFRFNAAGLIESFRAEARGAGAGQQMRMLPWEGRWSDYRERDGMRIPLTGEVAWMRPEGRKSYFVGSVTGLSFEFAS